MPKYRVNGVITRRVSVEVEAADEAAAGEDVIEMNDEELGVANRGGLVIEHVQQIGE
jgi:hypothetical protein